MAGNKEKSASWQGLGRTWLRGYRSTKRDEVNRMHVDASDSPMTPGSPLLWRRGAPLCVLGYLIGQVRQKRKGRGGKETGVELPTLCLGVRGFRVNSQIPTTSPTLSSSIIHLFMLLRRMPRYTQLLPFCARTHRELDFSS